MARLESVDNDKAPTRGTIALIAMAFNVHPDTLLYDNGDSEAA